MGAFLNTAATQSDSARRMSAPTVAGRVRLMAGASAVALLLAAGTQARAQDATWVGTTSDYNTTTNWNPTTVPTGTATFGATGSTSVTLSGGSPNFVGGVTFNAGAQAYTITSTSASDQFVQNGAGVINDSSNTQTLSANGGSIQFINSASAGTNVLLTASNGGFIQFGGTATGAGATVQLSSGGTLANQGAGNLNIGALSGVAGSSVLLTSFATATPSLTVGALNTSTTFGGVISEFAEPGAVTGSLIKVGTGTLTLSGANSYAGGTTVSDGTLALANNSAAGTNGITLSPGTTLALQGVQITNNIAVSGDPNITVTGANSIATITGAGVVNITGTSGSATTDVLTLTAANSYTADTNVGDGTTTHAVTLTATTSNFFSPTSKTTVTANSILDLGGAALTQQINQVVLAGGVIQDGSLNNSAVSSSGGTLSANLTGSSRLTTTGGLTVESGNNTYTGATNVNAGTLKAIGDNTLSADSKTTVAGTLELNGTSQFIKSIVLNNGTLQNGTLTGGIIEASGTINNIVTSVVGSAQLTTDPGSVTSLYGTNVFSKVTVAVGSSLTNYGNTQDDLDNNGNFTNNNIYTTNNVNNTGNFTNNGTFTGTMTNTTGVVSNNNSYSGDVAANGNVLTNNGAWGGNVDSNAGTLSNNGTWTGAVNGNTGSISNNKTWNSGDVNSNNGVITNNVKAIWTGSVNVNSNTTKNSIITNLGTWIGTGNNDGGTLSNSGLWKGSIFNNSGTFTNNTGGEVTGSVVNSDTGSNAGQIDAGLINNGGTFNNTNLITGPALVAAGTVTNSGTITGLASISAGATLIQTTTGTIGAGIDNSGLVQAAGQINGAITNETGGTFDVTGLLKSDGVSTFLNKAGGTLNVDGGPFENLLTLNNSGAVDVSSTLSVTGQILQNGPTFTIDAGGSVSANQFIQSAGLTLNNGSLTVTSPIAVNGGELRNNKTITGSVDNSALFRNNAGGSVSGDVINLGTASNDGTIVGHVNNQNLFTNNPTGVIDGGVTNTGTFNASGLIKGAIDNNLGTFTVVGALSSDGVSTFTNAAGATLDVKTGAFTNLATLVNAGTVTVESTLAAGTIKQNGPTFTIGGGGLVTATNFTQTTGTTINNGTLTVANPIAVNGGMLKNDKTINGSVINAATFHNNAGATVSGFVTNTGTTYNAGTISGLVTNNAGKVTTVGEIDGGVINKAIFNAAGVIKGAIDNQSGGLFTVTAALESDNISTFTNEAGATLDVKGGPFTQLASLVNAGTVTVESTLAAGTIDQNGPTFTIGGGGLVTATNFTQTTGTTINNGTLTVTNPIAVNGGLLKNDKTINGSVVNAAQFNNNLGATVSGFVTNSGTTFNAGTISGLVTNNAGKVTTIGEIDGGVVNYAKFFAAGTIKGAIDNRSGGKFTVTAALTSDGASPVTNEAGGTFDIQAAFKNVTTFNNYGTATVEATPGELDATTVNQYGGTFANNGAVNASNVYVYGGEFDNNAAGTITSPVTVYGGGTLNSKGVINGALINSGTVNAQNQINGEITNNGLFLVTGNLSNSVGSFTNNVGAQFAFKGTGLTYTGDGGSFTNNGTVTLGVYGSPASPTSNETIDPTTFINNNVLQGDGTIVVTSNAADAFTNSATGVIYVGSQNVSPQDGYNLTITGNVTNNGNIFLGTIDPAAPIATNPTNKLNISGDYAGAGTIFTTADFGVNAANPARANTIAIGGTATGNLDIALVNTNTNNFFGKLTVATFNGGAGFADTPATESALANASKGFYLYSYGKTAANGQGILQVPNAGVVAAPLSQVTSVIAALNASFFQNSAAFLGQAVCPTPGNGNSGEALPTRKGDAAPVCPAPNQWNFGVWNRDAAADTDIASTSTVTNNPAGAPQASHLDTRLAGFQYGLDAGLFNINNSGFNTHLGVTAGDVFTSSVDHANPGVTTSAQIPFVGAYGALTGHGFAGIVGVRYDTYDLNLNNALENVHDQSLGAHGLTFTSDAQYVIPLGTAAFIEPSGGLYISKVNVDNQTFAAGTNSVAPIYSTLSRLGLRLGMASQAAGILLQPFVAANVYHEWAGNAQETFTPVGAPDMAQFISSTRIGTFEQASVGVGWQVPNTGWTGYVRSDAKFGREVEGWTLTAGLRYNW